MSCSRFLMSSSVFMIALLNTYGLFLYFFSRLNTSSTILFAAITSSRVTLLLLFWMLSSREIVSFTDSFCSSSSNLKISATSVFFDTPVFFFDLKYEIPTASTSSKECAAPGAAPDATRTLIARSCRPLPPLSLNDGSPSTYGGRAAAVACATVGVAIGASLATILASTALHRQHSAFCGTAWKIRPIAVEFSTPFHKKIPSADSIDEAGGTVWRFPFGAIKFSTIVQLLSGQFGKISTARPGPNFPRRSFFARRSASRYRLQRRVRDLSGAQKMNGVENLIDFQNRSNFPRRSRGHPMRTNLYPSWKMCVAVRPSAH